MPRRAWPRLAAACADGERLPAPIAHAASVAAISIVATTIGGALTANASVARVVLHTLVAFAGYFGGASIAVSLAPIALRSTSGDRAARFASAASLPLLASGALACIPDARLALLWTAAGALGAAWSGFVGARALLGLEDGRRLGAAIWSLSAAVPIAIAHLFRASVL